MTAADISTIVLAAVAVIGVFAAALRWFFYRGAGEKEVTVALQANTAAQHANAEATDKLTGAFYEFRDSALGEFRQFDNRITRLEAAHNASSSAYRNSGSG